MTVVFMHRLRYSRNELIDQLVHSYKENQNLQKQIQGIVASQTDWFTKYQFARLETHRVALRVRDAHIGVLKEWNKLINLELPSDAELQAMDHDKFHQLLDDTRNKFNDKILFWSGVCDKLRQAGFGPKNCKEKSQDHKK